MLKREENFINRFIKHTRLVQDNMIFLEKYIEETNVVEINDFDLFKRSLKHDIDKLNDNLIESYILINKYYSDKRNNINSNIDIENIKENITLHYKTQRHHFYRNNIKENCIDILEMCCDIDAVAFEQNEENNTVYFENYMLKEFPKLEKHKNIIFDTFNILSNKNKSFKTKKSIFLAKLIKYIRKIQDNRLLLETNDEILSSKKIELFKNGLENDVKNIDCHLIKNSNYDEIFKNIKNNYIQNNDICEFVCGCCADAFINNNKNYFEYCKKFTNKLSDLDYIKKICEILIYKNI